MYRPSAEEFLRTLLESMDDLPPDFARRFEEACRVPGPSASVSDLVKKEDADRAQALRQLFEDLAGE